jgi:hypothetical protein
VLKFVRLRAKLLRHQPQARRGLEVEAFVRPDEAGSRLLSQVLGDHWGSLGLVATGNGLRGQIVPSAAILPPPHPARQAVIPARDVRMLAPMMVVIT